MPSKPAARSSVARGDSGSLRVGPPPTSPLTRRPHPSSAPGRPRHVASLNSTDATELHRWVILHDRAAIERVTELLLPVLQTRLRRAFPRVDPHIVAEAVEDAILAYEREPSNFHPDRSPLIPYLVRVASHDLLDRIRTDNRRSVREAEYAAFLRSQPRTSEAPHPDCSMIPVLARVAFRRGEPDRDAIRAWLEGERRTAVLAEALGLANLPVVDQRAEVKRFKDRSVGQADAPSDETHPICRARCGETARLKRTVAARRLETADVEVPPVRTHLK